MKQSRWLVLVLLLALPALAFGQAQTTGRITGTVVDDQGNPVANATVTATNTDLQLVRTATTSPSGDFLFALLPTGSYTVTVEAEGRQPQVYNLSLGVGQTAPINATLLPGEVITDEITVTGDQTALETTAVGENFDYETQVEQLPITNREIEAVAAYSPNISIGPTGDIAISGAPSFDTTILLDGAEISDPYFGSAPPVYLEDAIEEVQVLTSGVNARYGRFQGGVVNAITKSGGNEFEGTLRTELTNQSWNSQTPFGEEQADDLSETYQATLGGYIVRDRLWFFAGYRTIPTFSLSQTAIADQRSFTTDREEERYQAKIRGAISENHLVDVSYLNFDATSSNYAGLDAGTIDAVGLRTDPRETWTLAYQGVLTSNTFLELLGTRKDVSIALGGDPSKGDPFLDLGVFAVHNNSWWDITDPTIRNNETASIGVTHSLGTESFGTHTLEGGVQYINSITGGENRQSSTGFNLLAFNEDFVASVVNGVPRYNIRNFNAFRWEALPLGGDQEIENTAVYLQDTINLDKWRFDLGVRYEQYEGSGPFNSLDLDFDDIVPRIGVTYNVNPAWQLQASYGRYVGRFNDNWAAGITGVGGGPLIETIYSGPDFENLSTEEVEAILRNDEYWQIVTDFLSPANPTSFMAEDVTAPSTDEISLSVRHALPNNSGSVVLAYLDREYNDLLDDFQGLVCSDFGFDIGQPCSDQLTVPGDILVDTKIWGNNDRARRNYEAVNLLFDYRPTTRLQIGGNYTYSTLKGNYEGEGENTPASGSVFGDFERSLDIAAAAPDGYLGADVRHRASIFGSYLFNFGRAGDLSIGSLLFYRSGYPYSLTAFVPLSDTPEYAGDSGEYTHFFGGRGTERFNDWWSLDLSARYEVSVFSDVGLFLKAAVLNVLDNDEVIRFQTLGQAVEGPNGELTWAPVGNCGLGDEPSESCTGFGRIRNEDDYQDPRTFVLSVGIEF